MTKSHECASPFHQEILAEGRQEGEQLATERIAINLLRSRMNTEEVANLTNLTIEQIQILQSKVRSDSENY